MGTHRPSGEASASFAIDGTDPETYADVRRGARLETVTENVETLNRVRADSGASLPRLGIEFVALEENEAQITDLPEMAQRLKANRVLVIHVLPHTLEMAEQALYGRDERPPTRRGIQ